MAMFIHFHIVSDWFGAIMAELRSVVDTVWPENHKIFSIWTYKKVFTDS